MLKILWVEDEYSEQKQVSWFSNRSVCVKTSFDQGEEAINSCLAQFDLIVLDINLENSEHTDKVKALAKQFKITEQEFLQESGMNLFLNLREHGFPKEQIIFLTANADINISRIDELRESYRQGNDDAFDEIIGTITNELSEESFKKCSELIEAEDIEGLCQYLENHFNNLNDGNYQNTYNRFCEAYRRCRIEPPKAINKSLNESQQHLNHWLENNEKNDYLVLRRGIIEGCNFLKSHIEIDDNNIQFRDFIKTKNNQLAIDIPSRDIKNYLDSLSQFLAIKQPNDQNIQYRLFLRTIVHEWEENIEATSLKEKYPQFFSKKQPNYFAKMNDIYTFAWLIKMTRNWTSHASLLEPLNPQIIAFLFLVNMRAMFRLPKVIQPYERVLLRCLSLSPTNAIDFQNLNNNISYAEKNVDGILASLKIPEYKEDKNGQQMFDKNGKEILKNFGEKINAIYRQNTGNPYADEHNYKGFLLQYFWVNQKYSLRNLTATSDEFLPTLARHIYNDSFS
jgi:CheY-like chemotaxis protein